MTSLTTVGIQQIKQMINFLVEKQSKRKFECEIFAEQQSSAILAEAFNLIYNIDLIPMIFQILYRRGYSGRRAPLHGKMNCAGAWMNKRWSSLAHIQCTIVLVF